MRSHNMDTGLCSHAVRETYAQMLGFSDTCHTFRHTPSDYRMRRGLQRGTEQHILVEVQYLHNITLL